MQSLQDSLNKYDNPACYQKRLEDATFCIAAGDFEQGIQLLATSPRRFYSANHIDNFGLSLVPLCDFVLDGRESKYLCTGARLLYLNSNADEALRCCFCCRLRGWLKTVVIPQERLARRWLQEISWLMLKLIAKPT